MLFESGLRLLGVTSARVRRLGVLRERRFVRKPQSLLEELFACVSKRLACHIPSSLTILLSCFGLFASARGRRYIVALQYSDRIFKVACLFTFHRPASKTLASDPDAGR